MFMQLVYSASIISVKHKLIGLFLFNQCQLDKSETLKTLQSLNRCQTKCLSDTNIYRLCGWFYGHTLILLISRHRFTLQQLHAELFPSHIKTPNARNDITTLLCHRLNPSHRLLPLFAAYFTPVLSFAALK